MDFMHREHRNALPCLCPPFPSLEGTQVQRRPPTLARERLTNTCIRVDLTIAHQHAMFRLTDTKNSLATPIDPHSLATPIDPHSLATPRSHWPHPSILKTPHALATPFDPHNSTLTGHTHPPPLTTPHLLATPQGPSLTGHTHQLSHPQPSLAITRGPQHQRHTCNYTFTGHTHQPSLAIPRVPHSRQEYMPFHIRAST